MKLPVGATLSIVTSVEYVVEPASLSLIRPLTLREPLSLVEQLSVESLPLSTAGSPSLVSQSKA